MPIIQIPTAFNIDLEFEIAEFHKRLLAYVIDAVLLTIYFAFMHYLLSDVNSLDVQDNVGIYILVISFPMLIYPLVMELLLNGQTVGKMILGIRVVSLEGGEPTLGQFLMRWITRFWEWPLLFGFVSPFAEHDKFVALGFLSGLAALAVAIIVAVTPKNQRLGDMGAGTVIVNTKTDLGINDTVFMNVNTSDYKVMYPEVMRLSDRDINTIKSVVTQAHQKGNLDMCTRVAYRVQDVLKITTELYPVNFLEKLLEDYNYLATRE